MQDTVGRSTAVWRGRPAAPAGVWTSRESAEALLAPAAVAAALFPVLLAWTPGFAVSDTTAAVLASAIAALAAVAVVPLTSAARAGLPDSVLFTAALASAGAAAIHFAVIRMHFGEYPLYGVFFVGSGIAQLVWPVWVLLRRSQPLLVLGAIGNSAIVGLWVLDRVGAMPIGPDAAEPSPFGLGDSIASGFEALLVLACIVALVRGRQRLLGTRGCLALTLGAACLTTLALLSVLGAAPSVLPPAM